MSDHELILKAVVLGWSHRTRTGHAECGKQILMVELGRREFRFPVVNGFPTIDEHEREALLVELATREER